MLTHKYVHNGAVWQDFVCKEELQLLLMIAIKYTILRFDRNLSGENYNYVDDSRKCFSISTQLCVLTKTRLGELQCFFIGSAFFGKNMTRFGWALYVPYNWVRIYRPFKFYFWKTNPYKWTRYFPKCNFVIVS